MSYAEQDISLSNRRWSYWRVCLDAICGNSVACPNQSFLFAQSRDVTVTDTSSGYVLLGSPNHLIRSRENVGRNREIDLLCSLEIDDQVKLRRFLEWEICRFSALQNLVDVL